MDWKKIMCLYRCSMVIVDGSWTMLSEICRTLSVNFEHCFFLSPVSQHTQSVTLCPGQWGTTVVTSNHEAVGSMPHIAPTSTSVHAPWLIDRHNRTMRYWRPVSPWDERQWTLRAILFDPVAQTYRMTTCVAVPVQKVTWRSHDVKLAPTAS